MIQSLLPDSVPTAEQEIEIAKRLPLDEFLQHAVNGIVTLTINVLIAVVVFYIGKFLISRIDHVLNATMARRRADRSIQTFVASLVRITLYFLLIITVIGILGIETSSFIALFASAGVAIGMALSGTLQNFAGGVLILFIKPYKVGDYIEAQGYAGTVTEIQIFHTIINTADNKSIIIPNGGLSTGSVTNWSREDYRRVEWPVGISYGDDVQVAREAILEIIKADPRVVVQYIEDDRKERLDAEAEELERQLQEAEDERKRHGWIWRLFHTQRDKAKVKMKEWDTNMARKTLDTAVKVDRSPVVYVKELADSSVNLVARAWVRNSDYWALFFHINERIYNVLPTRGIHFPFPQLDVHVSDNS